MVTKFEQFKKLKTCVRTDGGTYGHRNLHTNSAQRDRVGENESTSQLCIFFINWATKRKFHISFFKVDSKNPKNLD